MPKKWVGGVGAWDTMLYMGTYSMYRITTGQKTLWPALRKTLRSHFGYALKGLRADGSADVNSACKVMVTVEESTVVVSPETIAEETPDIWLKEDRGPPAAKVLTHQHPKPLAHPTMLDHVALPDHEQQQ